MFDYARFPTDGAVDEAVFAEGQRLEGQDDQRASCSGPGQALRARRRDASRRRSSAFRPPRRPTSARTRGCSRASSTPSPRWSTPRNRPRAVRHLEPGGQSRATPVTASLLDWQQAGWSTAGRGCGPGCRTSPTTGVVRPEQVQRPDPAPRMTRGPTAITIWNVMAEYSPGVLMPTLDATARRARRRRLRFGRLSPPPPSPKMPGLTGAAVGFGAPELPRGTTPRYVRAHRPKRTATTFARTPIRGINRQRHLGPQAVEQALVVAPAGARRARAGRASSGPPSSCSSSGRAAVPISRIIEPPLPTRMPLLRGGLADDGGPDPRRVLARPGSSSSTITATACGTSWRVSRAPARARARRAAGAAARRCAVPAGYSAGPAGSSPTSSSRSAVDAVAACGPRPGAARGSRRARRRSATPLGDRAPATAGRPCSAPPRSAPPAPGARGHEAVARPGRRRRVEHQQRRVDVGSVSSTARCMRLGERRPAAAGSPAGRAARAATPGPSAMPETRRRVVCGRSDTIVTCSPQRALTSVDLPTFGRPASATTALRKALTPRRTRPGCLGPGGRPGWISSRGP